MSGDWQQAPFTIMGVVNVTPDSFSDGGRFLDAPAAVAHALQLEADGAGILDIGGESTRPGADPVPVAVELARVLPVIEGLRESGARAQISIDTSKAEVAAAALSAGASLVNDVTALRGDPRMAAVVADHAADVCLVHMQGDPRTMQREPRYQDVVAEVREFLQRRIAVAVQAGTAPARILIDPGIGFGKTTEHNLQLLARLPEISALPAAVLIGTSRKAFLGHITGREVHDRVAATIATNVMALERGARLFRVHDVAAVRDALLIATATVSAPWPRAIQTTNTTT